MDNYNDCHSQKLRVHAPYFLVMLVSFIFLIKIGHTHIFNRNVQQLLSEHPIGEFQVGISSTTEDEMLDRMEEGAGPPSSLISVSTEDGLSLEDKHLINKIIVLKDAIMQNPRGGAICNDAKILLKSVSEDFDLWHETKTTQIIPEYLWDKVFLLLSNYEMALISKTLKIDHVEIEKEQQARRLKMCQAFFDEIKELASWRILETLREWTSDINTSPYCQLSAKSSQELSDKLSHVLLSLDYHAYKTFIAITTMNHGVINADLPLVYSQRLLFILMRALGAKTLESQFPNFIDMHKIMFDTMRTINSLRLVNRKISEAVGEAMNLPTFFEHNNFVNAPHSQQNLIQASPVLAKIKKIV